MEPEIRLSARGAHGEKSPSGDGLKIATATLSPAFVTLRPVFTRITEPAVAAL